MMGAMEDYGPKIEEITRAKFSWWIPVGFGVFAIVITAIHVSRGIDGDSNLDPLFRQGVVWFFYFLTIVSILVGLCVDWNKVVLTVHENGIRSNVFKWTGSDFIPWKDVQGFEIKHIKQAFLVIELREPEKYFKKLTFSRKLNYFVEHKAWNTPIFVIITYRLSINPNLLKAICEKALVDYKAKRPS
jgi:hypothetical protein